MTDLAAALAEQGIRLRDYHPGQRYSVCPRCSAQRKPPNRKKPCLSIKIDEHGGAVFFCNHCEWKGNVPGVNGVHYNPSDEPESQKPKAARQPPSNPQHHPGLFGYFEKRGISRETVEQMGVYFGRIWFPQTEKKEPAVVYPYRLAGQVVNNKYRSAQKHFRQDGQAMKVLYNVDSLTDNDVCIWTEGENDVLSLLEVGFPSVVSLPDGAPAKWSDEADRNDARFAALANCAEQLAPIKKHILAVDNDGPGDNLAHQLALRLGKARCFRPTWPDQCKDPNEVLVRHGPDELRRRIDQAQGYPIEGLREIPLGTVFAYRDSPDVRTFGIGVGGFDRQLSWRPGQLAILVGTPGHGKTSFMRWLAVNFGRAQDWHWAVCSTEHDWRETVVSLVENKVGLPVQSYSHWDTPMDDETVSNAEAWVQKHFALIVQEDEDKPLTLDFVLEMARVSWIRHGTKALMIDPWNDLTHDQKEENYTEYVNQALRRLKLFARNHDMLVFLVVHPRTMYADKSGKRAAPTMYDIAGSANFYNRCDIGMTLWRRDPESTQVDLIVHKVKRRDQGAAGIIKLDWQRSSGQYKPVMGSEQEDLLR